MDLNKLYKSCTAEKHWQTVLVNAESVSSSSFTAISPNPNHYSLSNSYLEKYFLLHLELLVNQ